MSREVVLRMQPGESLDAFAARVAQAAPPLTPALTARLRSLLAIPDQAPAGRPAPQRATRAAA